MDCLEDGFLAGCCVHYELNGFDLLEISGRYYASGILRHKNTPES